MAFDPKAYAEALLVELQERKAEAERDKEGYERLVEEWELKGQQFDIHIEAVQEWIAEH